MHLVTMIMNVHLNYYVAPNHELSDLRSWPVKIQDAT